MSIAVGRIGEKVGQGPLRVRDHVEHVGEGGKGRREDTGGTRDD